MLIDMLRGLFSGGSVDMASVISQILATLFIIFCILPLHEFAHGWAAEKLGDHTAKYSGRLTMNPLASFDPVGSLFLLLFGFGWAKPVPIDSRYFKNPKRDTALTAVAGPLSNFLAAWVGGIIYFGLILAARLSLPGFVQSFFLAYITINVALAVFNLLPIPPLDGSKILGAFLSNRTLYNYYRYQNVIVMVAFLVLFSGMLDQPIWWLENLCLGGVQWLALLPYRFFGLV
ncbi:MULTISPECIES: site-2 protease family protein [Acutalibacteraceae]|uniref:site-2 protease family protein n=1 Tax=Acutalibacteraceae TaxID=3082771 RepID=UPI001FAA33B4|nr:MULTISPECIES: site-2 protease family protein [Acutalibacteraceae]